MDAPPWDLFCRVVDNHGDIGVCWRLAADLASRGIPVRMWVDDASALRWMAPDGARNVSVRAWPDDDVDEMPGAVVLEAFGCELPAAFVRRMAAMQAPPVWINLEYLSAEAYVERSHGLASPQGTGPGAGLRKHFFYPGFTVRTGGLIREADLALRQQAFDSARWLHGQRIDRRDGERCVSLFCYEQPAALSALLDRLSSAPTLLLVTHGRAADQLRRHLGAGLRRGGLRAHLLPALTQRDFDHLLWSCDLNFVRGEDSFVRAQWAAKPFVWQAYPQLGGAHHAKVDAFLAQFLDAADEGLAASVSALWRGWNSPRVVVAEWPAWPDERAWRTRCLGWRDRLSAQADLATQLIGFAAGSG